MHSSLIGKIEKARRYAQQPERVRFQAFEATFHGEHDEHTIALTNDDWRCTCHSFAAQGTCAHVMAAQRILDVMLSPEARTATGSAGGGSMHSSYIGKIEKARHYAQQPERIQFQSLDLAFEGGHDRYHVTLKDSAWQCSCHFFAGYGTCSHVMAVQRMLEAMLSLEARTATGLAHAV
jgi:hypothetical protein